jgi:signal transduction histidine kinase
MAEPAAHSEADIMSAFRAHDHKATFYNFKVACYLGIVLMPFGLVLDYFVYPEKLLPFLGLRILCSILIALFLAVVMTTGFGKRYYRLFGILLAMLPSLSISGMIYLTTGAGSPYYAGLNLVLLVVGFVLNWTFIESLLAVSMVFILYLAVCALHSATTDFGQFFNNIYFLGLTGVIVVTGSHVHTKLRFREFVLRYELDKNREQLEENNRKLKELDEAKSRFFANISHELRTPLTLLIAPLENVMKRFGSQVDSDTQNLLATMQANGMRLLKLINDLLDLVRLESGAMVVKREAIDLLDFAKGLISAVRQVAEDKRIRLESFVDPALGLVMADRDKLEKIILNLLFNALKFTPSGGRVELRAEKRGEELVLVVSDTGMGISEKNLPNVFSRFWQADDSSRRKYQGVGIGLALVKELTEAQDGTAHVASKAGEGTTFTIQLPYLKAEAAAVATPEETAVQTPASTGTVSSQEWLSNLYRRAELFPAMTSLQQAMRPVESLTKSKLPKVLIADDEPDMLRFLKSQLQAQYQVIEAVDGQQAVEKGSQFLPDIILLDMMMPEKDGLQACKELRERTPTQSIPIILLTARADEETKLAALSAGASDFLPKPFSTTELHVRIKNLVESFDYQRKLSKQNNVLENTIDQLKETESQLVQTEKLASLGRMSAGIIHEINNPLNFATTGLFTLRKKAQHVAPEERAEYSEILKDVEDGIARVKTIVSDLRSFSHHENEQVDIVPVSDLVTSSLRFLSHEYKDKVEISQNVEPGQTIRANKNKLIQVFVNIVQNALDALKEKEFPAGEKPTITIDGRSAGGKSLLIIRDNGLGIASHVMDKIFDPFFTTKDVGQGMGLGLSICYRIVQEYDGRILVKSEPGKFCEFTLEFPAERQSEEPEVTGMKQSYA